MSEETTIFKGSMDEISKTMADEICKKVDDAGGMAGFKLSNGRSVVICTQKGLMNFTAGMFISTGQSLKDDWEAQNMK